MDHSCAHPPGVRPAGRLREKRCVFVDPSSGREICRSKIRAGFDIVLRHPLLFVLRSTEDENLAFGPLGSNGLGGEEICTCEEKEEGAEDAKVPEPCK